MAKITQKVFAGFCEKIPSSISAFLSYGNDEGLVFESAQSIAKKINPDLNDPFNVEYLTTAQIKENPSALYMAASASSLMGGKKLIIVKDAADGILTGLKDYLENDYDAFLVLYGAGLSRKSTIVQLIENSDNAMGMGCYADDTGALQQLIVQMLGANGITATNEAISFLVSKLGADRKMTKSEINKLITYLGDEKTLDTETVLKVIDDASAVSFENLTDAIFTRNPKKLSDALHVLYKEGESEVAVIRITLFFIKKLLPAFKVMEEGQGISTAMGYIRPKLNFKQEAVLKPHFGKWNYGLFNRAIEILLEAEVSCKSTNSIPSIVCERALLQIINIR